MLNLLVLTPVHGDDRRVRGQRSWEHPQQKGWPSNPFQPSPAPAPPCAAEGSCTLLRRLSCCSWASLQLFGAAQATPLPPPPPACPRGMPCKHHPMPLQHKLSQATCSGVRKKVTFVVASILPLHPHPCLENTARFLQLGMYFSSLPY